MSEARSIYRLLLCRHELVSEWTLFLNLICKAMDSGIIWLSGDLNFELNLLCNVRNFYLGPQDLHHCCLVHQPEMAIPWLFVAQVWLCRDDSYEMHISINNWVNLTQRLLRQIIYGLRSPIIYGHCSYNQVCKNGTLNVNSVRAWYDLD